MRRRTLTDGASKIYSLDECIWVEVASQNILNFLNESSIKNQIYGVAVLAYYSTIGSKFLGDITYFQFSNGYKFINTYGNSSNPNVRYLQDNNNNNITTNMSTIPVGKIYSYVSNDEKVIIAHHTARGFTTSYKTFTSEVPFSITFVEDPETTLWVLVPYDVISYMDKFKDMEWVAVTSSLVNAINNTNQSIVYGLRGFDYKPSVSTAIDRKIYLLNGAYLREYREVGINHVYMYLKNTDISNVFTYGASIIDYKRYYSFNGGNPIQKESSQDEAYSSATYMLHMLVCNGTKITSSDFPMAENIHVLILVPRYFLDSYKVVNLGLPSGTLWSNYNIIKEDSVYKLSSSPQKAGCYFSWGNIEGYNSSDSYSWTSDTYSSTSGADLISNIAPTSGYDAARELLGGYWRMPSSEMFQELFDNCTVTWVSNYNRTGKAGTLFTSNVSGYTDKSIFFPACGTGTGGSSIVLNNTRCYYWSTTRISDSNAYGMRSYNGSLSVKVSMERYQGKLIRPVIVP